jgi:hypothetical protein
MRCVHVRQRLCGMCASTQAITTLVRTVQLLLTIWQHGSMYRYLAHLLRCCLWWCDTGTHRGACLRACADLAYCVALVRTMQRMQACTCAAALPAILLCLFGASQRDSAAVTFALHS